VPYVRDMGFTQLELMPVSEYPFDGSWGYQPVGLFAPTSRFGPADDFRVFVEACHAAGIALWLDWVPGHFPTDPHGLARFDGTALYEHADPRQGFQPDWNTYVYNFGRREVANFLLSNARYWIDAFHIDGLRVDAVASMLYLDYSRQAGEWVPNEYGGRENLAAIALLKRMNELVFGPGTGATTATEESKAWPMVSPTLAPDRLASYTSPTPSLTPSVRTSTGSPGTSLVMTSGLYRPDEHGVRGTVWLQRISDGDGVDWQDE